MRRIATALATLLLTTTPLHAGGPNIKPGLWEWTTQMSMPGMQLPASRYSSCVTEADLVPRDEHPSGDCKVVEQAVDGNSVRWKVLCHSPHGDSTTEGEMHYSGNSANGTMHVTTQGMTMNATLSGRRSGDCR